jgi:hypothetical protein
MKMKVNAISALGLLVCGVALTISAGAQTENGVPHLRKQGTATQLIVDGKPFLALAGELMYVNGWLQQPNHAWPGTYPSCGPMPQVHDIWRAGAPDVDILAPDLYLPYFDEVCERFSRSGNPLFIPKTGTNAANLIMAVGKFNTIRFSLFGVDGGPIPSDLAATYEMLNNMAPMILAHQGSGTMTAVRMVDGDPPKQVKLGNCTLTFSYTGRSMRVAPQAKGGVVASPPPPQPGAQPEQSLPPLEATAVVISAGPDEYYFGGGGVCASTLRRTRPDRPMWDSVSCSKDSSWMESGNLPVGSKAMMMRRERSWC